MTRRRLLLAGSGLLAAVLCGALLLSAVFRRDPFEAPPYAGFVDLTRVVIVRHSRVPVRAEARLDDGKVIAASGQARSQALRFDGLEPGREYRFVWREREGAESPEGGGAERTFEGRFRTAPAAGPVRFAAIGDFGKTRVGKPWRARGRHFEVASAMAAWRPDLVVMPGDLVYDEGAFEEYAEGFFAPFAPLLRAGVALFPSLGDHDIKTRYARPYFAAFPLPQDGEGGGYYYSFDWGDVHFAAIDTVTRAFDRDYPQRAWLERDLGRTRKRWKVVFGHTPPFHGRSKDPELPSSLPALLARAGAQLYVAGHYHLYERIGPVDGVLYVTSGGGGKSLHEPVPSHPLTRTIAARYQYLRATVEGGTCALEAVTPEGETIDRDELRLE